jgi:hypothetical protein
VLDYIGTRRGTHMTGSCIIDVLNKIRIVMGVAYVRVFKPW